MNLSVLQDASERIHYPNPAVPIYISYGNLRSFTNMSALCHWHEEVELILPVQGYLAYNVNGRQILLEEGNAVFINSRQMHYGFTADGTDCEYICICFKPGVISSHPYFYEQYVRPITDNPNFGFFKIENEVEGNEIVLQLIRQIAKEERCDLLLMGKLCELWQRIYDLLELNAVFIVDKNTQILKQMLTFIHTQYGTPLSLARIAKSGGVCKSKCCQIFKAYIGKTPNQYVTAFRLERSIELLRESGKNMTEIATVCGFNSASYFTEVFSREKGCTPTDYRKKWLP